MQVLIYAHLGISIILLAGSLAMAIMALKAKAQGVLPQAFWRGTDHVERLLVVEAILGVTLYIVHPAHDPLHYLYGAVALLLVAVERGLRPGRSLRETVARDYGRFNEPVVFAVLMFIIFALLGRAFTTGLWGF